MAPRVSDDLFISAAGCSRASHPPRRQHRGHRRGGRVHRQNLGPVASSSGSHRLDRSLTFQFFSVQNGSKEINS